MVVIAADAADIFSSADCAGAVAVFDCGAIVIAVVIAADAADITACSADCAGAVAVFD